MVAKFFDERLLNGNPCTRLNVDGNNYTFPYLDNTRRAEMLLVQLGYSIRQPKSRKSPWRKVGGGCGHSHCESKSYLAATVDK